ncbi:MAG: choice-of-anchor D domain-containing protein, partial [Phycisphaerales bacterium]|nr:choice-of-anchor D domain-containing protein [Phycisphaerales bacterium]
DDIVLGVEREIEDLLAGQSSAESESWRVPSGIAAGDYFLGVFIDSTDVIAETDEQNNIAWSAQTVSVGSGGGGGGGGGEVDLTLERVIADPTPRPVGEDVHIAWTIVNAGGFFNGAFDQEVHLSLDNVWGNADDIVLGVEPEDEDFAPGQRSFENESFVIPLGTPEGVYYVGVFIDASGEIAESDEANNIAMSAEPVVTVGSGGGGGGGGSHERAYSVFGSGRHIEDDDVSPRRDDSTAFNRLRVDGRIREREFEIRNFGDDDLRIENVEVRGRHKRDFVIAVAPNQTLAPGESTVVILRFDPIRGGVRKARLAIETSRDTDDAYEFKVKGRGFVPTNAPDATVEGRRDREIRDGDLRAGGGDGTRFRSLELGEAHERTFTLRNDGVQTLILATPLIRLTGSGASAFSVLSMPAMILAPGASTSFTIRFAPETTGKFRSNVEILSNDPDEAAYTFRIVGRAE